MSNGSIVEQGTHSELMELQGFYLALVNTGKSGEKDGLDSELTISDETCHGVEGNFFSFRYTNTTVFYIGFVGGCF